MKKEETKKTEKKSEEKIQKKKKEEEELSPEDKELKEKIEFKVERICENSEKNPIKHIDELLEMVASSKKSRTAIPKEIKFLKTGYKKLVERFNELKHGTVKSHLSDLLSFICISLADDYKKSSLTFLQNGTGTLDLKHLGEEYILNLAGDVGDEYNDRFSEQNQNFEDLFKITDKILPLMFKNGDEISAIDLLLEIEQLDKISKYLKKSNYLRLFNYLLSSIEYAGDSVESEAILACLFDISLQQRDLVNALRIAIRRDDIKLV